MDENTIKDILRRYKSSKSKNRVYNVDKNRMQSDSPTARKSCTFMEIDVGHIDSELGKIQICGEKEKLETFAKLFESKEYSSSEDEDDIAPPTERESMICNIACHFLHDCSEDTVLAVRDRIEPMDLNDVKSILETPTELDAFLDLFRGTKFSDEPEYKPSSKRWGSMSETSMSFSDSPFSEEKEIVEVSMGIEPPDVVETEILETFEPVIASRKPSSPKKPAVQRRRRRSIDV